MWEAFRCPEFNHCDSSIHSSDAQLRTASQYATFVIFVFVVQFLLFNVCLFVYGSCKSGRDDWLERSTPGFDSVDYWPVWIMFANAISYRHVEVGVRMWLAHLYSQKTLLEINSKMSQERISSNFNGLMVENIPQEMIRSKKRERRGSIRNRLRRRFNRPPSRLLSLVTWAHWTVQWI